MTQSQDLTKIEFFNQTASSGRFDSYTEDDIRKMEEIFDDIQFMHGEVLKVLDCGCGTGRAMDLIARRVAPGSIVTGADSSPAMIERAKKLRKAPEGVKFDFAVADCLSLPFDDGTFDWVMLIDTFPHIPDFPGALREVSRVLKAGGFVAILDRQSSDQMNEHHKKIGGPVANDIMPGPLDFLQLIRSSGLWLQIYIDDKDGFRFLARK